VSLGPEFFDARDALILKREAGGDIELEHFLEDRGVLVDDLYELSLLKVSSDTKVGVSSLASGSAPSAGQGIGVGPC